MAFALACASVGGWGQTPAQRAPDPDAAAYRAFAAGDANALAQARVQGGDAARYAKQNPDAIYDAMSAQRDVSVLEFVLASGANPNAQRNPSLKGTPMFAGVMDGDKVKLLIKYGADVNARDHNGYTPLSYVLFDPARQRSVPLVPRAGQRVRTFTKLALVKLLIDGGAEINGNLGGMGTAGALGLTQREDTDVIAVLIERGATLKGAVPTRSAPGTPSPDLGPLTIAVEMDRDDLALALVNRDRKVGAKDVTALLEATRRGFTDAAIAILNAGADPNLADAKGAMPLDWAMRRKDDRLVTALRKAGAKSSGKPIASAVYAQHLEAFDAAAGAAIDGVAILDADRFYLELDKRNLEAAFAFYGNQPGKFEVVQCERAAAFTIIANQGEAGGIAIGRCRNEAKRVRDAANFAKGGVSQLLGMFGQKINPEQATLLGWEWRTNKAGNGWIAYSFPLFMLGHGVLWLNTIVLLNDAQTTAVIVQAQLDPLCERSNPGRNGARIRTPLCQDTTRALTDIALAVAGKS